MALADQGPAKAADSTYAAKKALDPQSEIRKGTQN
jgi:hypothetical protein